MTDGRWRKANWGRGKLPCYRGREPFPWEEKRQRRREGLRECSFGFPQEENLTITTDLGAGGKEQHIFLVNSECS